MSRPATTRRRKAFSASLTSRRSASGSVICQHDLISFDSLFSHLRNGKGIFLKIRYHPDISLRGNGVHISSEVIMLNLGFGINLPLAVQKFHLKDSDFSPSDLTMEFLFLHEANRAALLELSRSNMRLEKARKNAHILSITDPLTGLLNRRGFDIEFSKAFEYRQKIPFAILHLDLDCFKEVNDKFGHAAGDRVLIDVASILTGEVHFSDKACRVGGDEFMILIFSQDPKAVSLDIGRRILNKIETMKEHLWLSHISASVGIATSDSKSTPQPHEILEMSDAALYRAKVSGRGKIVLWRDGF
ncbi:GGDEF domain-containing protein [Paracoccus methylovorus]|uniref:diguanylate cyclase n=1 Tax=Paracoccus methylovorus TaxID=2812658 RepID=A0ABX7JL77_9RHOB|nr:GGDEF domain-containing protein [Paracoccus methylovorus]